MARVPVAIALFDEEQVLPELLKRLRAVLDQIPEGPHEMVFVNQVSLILRASYQVFSRLLAAERGADHGA